MVYQQLDPFPYLIYFAQSGVCRAVILHKNIRASSPIETGATDDGSYQGRAEPMFPIDGPSSQERPMEITTDFRPLGFPVSPHSPSFPLTPMNPVSQSVQSPTWIPGSGTVC